MNLQKDKWEKVKFGEIAKSSNLACDPLVDGIERFVAGEHMITDEIKIKNCGNVNDEILGPAFHRKFLPNQILYGSRRTYLRKVAISDFEGVCANTTFVIDANTNKTSIYFLACVMQSEKFTEFSINNSKGSTNPFINWKDLAAFIVYLPPLDEQERIVALFRSIEQSIVQVEGQEANLLKLKNQFLRDLFGEKRQFGSYLSAKDFENVKFEQIALNISERVEPKQTNLEIYVGLEHLDSDDLVIRRKGKPEDVIGTKLKIFEGDIIFGKRRAYLRKVAVADFEGIVSAHSMVLRANEENIEKDFLPYFMQSDEFMNRAVQISEGSLSPTIKWKTLAQQEFMLPKREKQAKLIDMFKQFDEARELIRQQKETLKTLKQKLLNEILG